MTTTTNHDEIRTGADKYRDFNQKIRDSVGEEPCLSYHGYNIRREKFGDDYTALIGRIADYQSRVEMVVLNEFMSKTDVNPLFEYGYLCAIADVMELINHYEKGTIGDLPDAEHY